MAIAEDDVKRAIHAWLIGRRFSGVEARMGTAPGPDVQGVCPDTGRRLIVECKGETDADNQWDRAWRNVSQGLFNTIKHIESPDKQADDFALALPDTEHYRQRMSGLEDFCNRERIDVYWVAEDGGVRVWS